MRNVYVRELGLRRSWLWSRECGGTLSSTFSYRFRSTLDNSVEVQMHLLASAPGLAIGCC